MSYTLDGVSCSEAIPATSLELHLKVCALCRWIQSAHRKTPSSAFLLRSRAWSESCCFCRVTPCQLSGHRRAFPKIKQCTRSSKAEASCSRAHETRVFMRRQTVAAYGRQKTTDYRRGRGTPWLCIMAPYSLAAVHVSTARPTVERPGLPVTSQLLRVLLSIRLRPTALISLPVLRKEYSDLRTGAVLGSILIRYGAPHGLIPSPLQTRFSLPVRAIP